MRKYEVQLVLEDDILHTDADDDADVAERDRGQCGD